MYIKCIICNKNNNKRVQSICGEEIVLVVISFNAKTTYVFSANRLNIHLFLLY